ncbi:MAG: hypothetical protein HY248_05840 [Fimbriimonas ginsengisoli]|nr:hypothetical protein [Fimbriimonas ginsengisoli]
MMLEGVRQDGVEHQLAGRGRAHRDLKLLVVGLELANLLPVLVDRGHAVVFLAGGRIAEVHLFVGAEYRSSQAELHRRVEGDPVAHDGRLHVIEHLFRVREDHGRRILLRVLRMQLFF